MRGIFPGVSSKDSPSAFISRAFVRGFSPRLLFQAFFHDSFSRLFSWPIRGVSSKDSPAALICKAFFRGSSLRASFPGLFPNFSRVFFQVFFSTVFSENFFLDSFYMLTYTSTCISLNPPLTRFVAPASQPKGVLPEETGRRRRDLPQNRRRGAERRRTQPGAHAMSLPRSVAMP